MLDAQTTADVITMLYPNTSSFRNKRVVVCG